MIVKRLTARLELALQNQNPLTLASIARDIGDELVRKDKDLNKLREFLARLDDLHHTLNGAILPENKSFIVATSNIVSAAIARIEDTNDKEALKDRIDMNKLRILRIIKNKALTADMLSERLSRELKVIVDDLNWLNAVDLVECFGMKKFWSLTGLGETTLQELQNY